MNQKNKKLKSCTDKLLALPQTHAIGWASAMSRPDRSHKNELHIQLHSRQLKLYRNTNLYKAAQGMNIIASLLPHFKAFVFNLFVFKMAFCHNIPLGKVTWLCNSSANISFFCNFSLSYSPTLISSPMSPIWSHDRCFNGFILHWNKHFALCTNAHRNSLMTHYWIIFII